MPKPHIGISPITGTIYAGKSKESKIPGVREWVGEKHDITDETIRSVFEHMMHKAKDANSDYFSYTFPNFGTMEINLKEVEDRVTHNPN